MPYIIEDTYSMQNRSRLWAKAGTEVVVISGAHGTSIVQPKDGGEKFVVHDEELTDDPRKCKNSFALNGLALSDPTTKSSRPKPAAPPPSSSSQSSLF